MTEHPIHLAFVSYEYAGLARGGGIGTYVRNAATSLAARGHSVEVFTEGPQGTYEADGVMVHAIRASERGDFPRAVVPVFRRRHEADPFDVMESAEYRTDGVAVAEAYPDLPLVVKLHTPASLINEINHRFIPWTKKARFLAGGLVRGRVLRPYWMYDPDSDPERSFALLADEVTSPSRDLLDLSIRRWGLNSELTAHVPNVFVPPPELLGVPPETQTRRVTFVGKLEVRKGVVELIDAVPHVLDRVPGAQFRLIGRSIPHPATGTDMVAFLQGRLGRHAAAVEFVEAVPYNEISAYYADTDVCAFPSVWENFPNVCLEAMAAARGVVGSSSGGMAEMIEDGETGRLVPPGDPRALAGAIAGLLADAEARVRMGRAARSHATQAYAPKTITPIQEASYHRAISRARQNARPLTPSAT